MAEAGCLIWLTDLTLTNIHHIELRCKGHLRWDEGESKNKPFTIQNCMQVALKHWTKVCETELTMGPKPGGGGSLTGAKPGGGDGLTGETSDGTQPKSKKRKKNKKPKTNQSDGDGTAATVTMDKAPFFTSKDPPKIATSSYCF